MMVERTDSGARVQIPVHPLRGQLLNILVPQFPHTVFGDNNSTYLFGRTSGLNELIYVKCLENCLAQSKC